MPRMAPFPQRSRPGLLTQAACGGLHPAPASRVREASPAFSHLLRRLLRHTEICDPELIRARGAELPVDEIGRPRGGRIRLRRDPPGAPAHGPAQVHRTHQALDGAPRDTAPLSPELPPDFPR